MSARRIVAQARFELRLLLRNAENLLVTLAIPVGLLVFFSVVDVLPIPGPAVDFLVPGMLALSVMASAMVSLGIATGFERAYFVLKRLGVTPLRRSELVAAKGLAVGAIIVVQLLTVVGVGRVLGWHVEGANLLRATVVGGAAVVAGAAAFAGIGLAVAGRLRALAALALLNGLFVVLLLVSGVAFPLSALPDPVATAAATLPSAALATVLRSALDGSGPLVAPALVLAGWAVAMPLLAARAFRWE